VLFTAGVFAATGGLHQNIFTISSLLTLASFAGGLTGYAFGRKVGPLLYKRKDTWFFRRQHLTAATAFYEKHGGIALTIGYFLPIIRTFSPVVAGMAKLKFPRFALFTFAGSACWVTSFVLAGYFIGSRPFLKPWLKYIVIGFIVIVTVPLLIRIIRELRKPNDDKNKFPE
jgi:membrane-associated protein